MLGASRGVGTGKAKSKTIVERDTLETIELAARTAAEIVATKLAALQKSPKCDPHVVNLWNRINMDVSATFETTRRIRGGALGARTPEEIAAAIRAQVAAAESLPTEER